MSLYEYCSPCRSDQSDRQKKEIQGTVVKNQANEAGENLVPNTVRSGTEDKQEETTMVPKQGLQRRKEQRAGMGLKVQVKPVDQGCQNHFSSGAQKPNLISSGSD